MLITNNVKRDELAPGVILSIVKVPFMNWFGDFETAITFDDEGSWHILKGYDSRKEAIIGHEYFKELSIEQLEKLKPIG